MGRSKKSKRVAWASDVNLCQVRLFLLEESPSQVGMRVQDQLKAKGLWPVQSGGIRSDDNLPPGFEGIQPSNLWGVNLSQIPLMKWKCPPRFEVDSNWRVVAGEESAEAEAQNQREMRVLEAIYPRPSAVPPNPSALLCIDDSTSNDQNIPVVPITPIEDEDAALDTSFGSTATNSTAMILQSQNLSNGTFSSLGSATLHPPRVNGISSTGMEPGIVAAAQAALTSVLSNSDAGTLIDRDLLIKILGDPKTIEHLLTSHGRASSSTPDMQPSSSAKHVPSSSSSSMHNMPSSSLLTRPAIVAQNVPLSSLQTRPAIGAQNVPSSSLKTRPAIGAQNVPSSSLQTRPALGSQHMPSISTPYLPNLTSMSKNSFDPVNIAIQRREPLTANITRPQFIAPSIATTTRPFYPPPPAATVPITKDINYYKSLIQQHGGEKREIMPQYAHQSNQPFGTSPEPLNSRDSQPKIMRPCIYFNSSRGCRNGANCVYQHDITSSQQRVGVTDVPNAKRVKLDREIIGT